MADRVWIGDRARGICTPCAQELRAAQVFECTESLIPKTKTQCLGCGDTCYHGIRMCTECRSVLCTWIWKELGPEGLDENPLVYEMWRPVQIFNSAMTPVSMGVVWMWMWESTESYAWLPVKVSGLQEKIPEALDIR